MTKPTYTIALANEDETLDFAGALAAATPNGAVIFLHGSLGAGKTTLVRGFLHSLGYTGKVKSPTYTLVEPYEIGDRQIFHFDLYRLIDPNELKQIGIEEYFSGSSICIIEWPDKGYPLLPVPDIACYIEFKGSGREMKIEAHTPQGNAILTALS